MLTYIEYKAVSGVFRTIDPPPPFHLASVSSPLTKGGVGVQGGEGVGGVKISEDAKHGIGLLQYNPSTIFTLREGPRRKQIETMNEPVATCWLAEL